jgi:hypothetical protein
VSSKLVNPDEAASLTKGRGPTPQVLRAIQALKQAGFSRRDFTVTVAKKWRTNPQSKQRYVEYGSAQICLLRGALADTLARTPALLSAGIDVTWSVIGGKFFHPRLTPGRQDRGKLALWILDEADTAKWNVEQVPGDPDQEAAALARYPVKEAERGL